MTAIRVRIRALVDGLWFLPSTIALALGGLSFGLVQIDERTHWGSDPWVFGGSASAARVVLTTIAGSLITVAGLTFSVTMIVLQLASSQFSPRVLKTFLRDRFTQLTVGVFIGIFIYCLIGLRSVGGRGDFVPRLTVTIASALGVAAVILLIVFIHHISTLIEVSHIAARIGRETLGSLDRLYPERYGDAAGDDDAGTLLDAWEREGPPAELRPLRPGYVQRLDVNALVDAVSARPARIQVTAAPGDFVSGDLPVLRVWPAAAAAAPQRLRRALVVTDERDLAQDAAFGVRQLADIALRAISPGINDPTTAVTCIGYIRSVLERLAARALPSAVRRFDDREVTIVSRRVGYREYLETLSEIGRYAAGDARIVRQLVRAGSAARDVAVREGSEEFARVAREITEAIAEQGADEARGARDRALIRELAGRAPR